MPHASEENEPNASLVSLVAAAALKAAADAMKAGTGKADAAAVKPVPWPARMSRRRASDYLQIVHGLRAAYQTLAKHGVQGTGPAYRKQGRFALYDKKELDRWADLYLSKPCASTAEHFVQEEQRRKSGVKFDYRKRIKRDPERTDEALA